MNTCSDGFAIWMTGLPASGKTAIARQLRLSLLNDYNIRMISLESDELRTILTPAPVYSLEEREWFYGVLVYLAGILTSGGVHVLLDATANRRGYRNAARASIPRFLEVYVRCPLEVCMARDPKGIYRKARGGISTTVPGLQEAYEEPDHPEVVIDSDCVKPEDGALMVLRKLQDLGWIKP